MKKPSIILLHLAAWTILFLSPMSFLGHGARSNPQLYLAICVAPVMQILIFYINYLWLTPKYFFDTRRKRKIYWMVNLIGVVVLGLALHIWMDWVHTVIDPMHQDKETPMGGVLFAIRDIFSLLVADILALTVVLVVRWQHTEQARYEAETARTEAELRNLRSQIKPHFLLNTLNNIYALVAFDTAKAQKAIYELSQLLRHILYDNQMEEVNFSDEIAFMENYIKLMKLRLPDHVDVKFKVHTLTPNIKIAPLIFISLIENAFKHGVSATERSFIDIRFTEQDRILVCDITNSNHPKGANDHSGHGIGLQQVQRRLDLSYPGRYQWTKDINTENNTYQSTITIRL